MSAEAGPFTIAALLLVAGGVSKALAPGDTANALRALGLPGPPVLVRVGGVAEAVIAAVAIATADRVAVLLVAVSYLAFAGFVAIALRRGTPIATCGCFGKADTPPSLMHLFVNLGAAVAALAIAFNPGDGIGDVVAAQPLSGVPYLLLTFVGTYVAFLTLTLLPRTLALVRQSRDS